MNRLNVGCGRNIREGWVNLDSYPLAGVDLVADLEALGQVPLPLADNSVTEFSLSHVLEHIKAPLPMLQELWRVAAPQAIMEIRCPYGSSDDAWEDPTHVRAVFLQTTGYFSQPYYWRADYGYRGDWATDDITLWLSGATYERLRLKKPGPILFRDAQETVMRDRNVVREIVFTLSAIKPIREAKRDLIKMPEPTITNAGW